MAGTQSSRSFPRSHKQLRISYVQSGGEEYEGKHYGKSRQSSRSSRRDRVQPEGQGSYRAMNGAEKGAQRKPKLEVQTDYEQRQGGAKTPSGKRGSRDLRSPGGQKTPVAGAALLPSNQALPDFITQTDANGNATTPRSAAAIDGARKYHPTGPKPRLHVDRGGHLSEDSDDEERDSKAILSPEDPCDSLLDSLRMMCCCFMEDVKPSNAIQGQGSFVRDARPKLLGALHHEDTGKKCLVLDLDETLVHSSFRAVPGADFVIPVPIEDVVHFVYVMKRPGVDEFLLEMAKHYEIVIYTASLNKYADPLLDLLDPHQVIRYRLFRESCVFYQGNYVKDLSLLDRKLEDTIIIDNSPSSYLFHPENAIDCSSFIDDPRDRELDQIGAFLAGIKDVKDVRGVAPQWREWPSVELEVEDKYSTKAR
eukprot:Nitzschia sp. Nitz4//scaffold34_size148208//14549//16311//NITZ4_002958-RA/size148208-snap-gene-0.205-mRNA-1//1//CDS//3329548729//64//frame0